jgi:hypothetical protein
MNKQLRRIFAVAIAMLLSVVLFPGFAHAQVSVVVPTSMDPGTIINSCMASLGGYMTDIVAAVVILAIVVAVLAWIRRKPKAMAK